MQGFKSFPDRTRLLFDHAGNVVNTDNGYGVTVIVGHTPTPLITGIEDAPAKICHGDGIIDIDCGCAFRSQFSRLACIRLDDMAEFYI